MFIQAEVGTLDFLTSVPARSVCRPQWNTPAAQRWSEARFYFQPRRGDARVGTLGIDRWTEG